MKDHHYSILTSWTGNKGTGTSGYKDFERSYTVEVANKPDLYGSSDPAFLGDQTKYNPEEMLVASLSSCHMLWYLHLCAVAGVIVLEYSDNASGIMEESKDGSGFFKSVTLKPNVVVADPTMVDKANELHEKANKMCFIANSVNFPVLHVSSCKAE